MRKFVYLIFLFAFSLFSVVFTQTANAQQQPIARWYFVDKSYTTGFKPFDSFSDRVTRYGKEYESITKSPYFIYAAICAALDPQSEAKATQQVVWYYQKYIPTDQFKTKKFESVFTGLIGHYRDLAKAGKLTLPAIKMYGYIMEQKGFQYDFDASALILNGDYYVTDFGGEAWGLYTNNLMIRFAPLNDNVNSSNEFAAYGGAKFSFPSDADSAEKIYNELKPILAQTSVGKATDALWYYITYTPQYNPQTFKFYNNPLYAMSSAETTVALFKGRCIHENGRISGFKDLKEIYIYRQSSKLM